MESDVREYIARYEGEYLVPDKMREIVRCRDCLYGAVMNHGFMYMCESPDQSGHRCTHLHEPDWYCADGKRGYEDDGRLVLC